MKYRDGVLGLVVVITYIIGGATGLMPFAYSTPIIIVVGLVAILFWKDPNFLGDLESDFRRSKNNDLVVQPNEALDFINEESKKIPGYRPLDLDRTSKKNMELHTSKIVVNENGEKKTKFGVVGRPKNQNDTESIAYIVHCNDGTLEYDGERWTAEARLDPFHGTKWVENAGYRAKVENDEPQQGSRGGVNIYQGGVNDKERGSGAE